MFDWEEYLILAEELAKSENEAYQRASISRAYYSVYCGSRNYLVDHGESISTSAASHQEVSKIFQSSVDSNKRKIGVTLSRLRRNRNRADYNNRVLNLQQLVEDSLVQAKDLYTILRDMKHLRGH